MKLRRASLYAIYGLSYLASRRLGGLVPIREISKKSGIPEKHLAKLFRALVVARILKGVPGPNGGFALARPARKISVLDVVTVFEGSSEDLSCLLDRTPCAHVAACRVGTKLHAAQDLMTRALARLSIQEVAQDSRPPSGSKSRSPG